MVHITMAAAALEHKNKIDFLKNPLLGHVKDCWEAEREKNDFLLRRASDESRALWQNNNSFAIHHLGFRGGAKAAFDETRMCKK